MMAIPEGATPLVVGTLLALGALSLVLAPLLTEDKAQAPGPPERPDEPAGDTASPSILALREIEFDRATGKLSESDYADLKSRYTTLALAEMRIADGRAGRENGSADIVDPVEAAILRAKVNQRTCTTCGPCSEPDAIYCPGCGKYLPGQCSSCGAPVDAPGARFCSGCGKLLAA